MTANPSAPPEPADTHQALYHNTPLVLCGLLGAIALLGFCIWGAISIATNGDQLMTLMFASLGLFVLASVVCILLALRRHGWTLLPAAVQVAERPLVPLTGPRRAAQVPYGAIAGLFTVQNMREELLELRTRDGRRLRLPPGLLPGEGPKGIRYPDQAGLAAFAERLRAAAAASGHALPPVVPGLGFWNRAPGLGALGVAFLAALGLAVIAVWALFEGAASRHRGGEAVGLLVMLPVGLAWLLRNAWRRRRAMRGTSG